MSKDCGKALNGIANVVEQEGWPCSAQLIRETADEIERLQKRNALLEGVAVAAEDHAESYCAGGLQKLQEALSKLGENK